MIATTSRLPASVLIVGFARTGQAVARVLDRLSVPFVAIDDRPSELALDEAGRLGAELLVSPDAAHLAGLVSAAELVVLSPGVAPSHAIFSVASPEQLVSEIELAYRLLRVPVIAITGTNGKTSVTGLVAAMLQASGLCAKALGNIGSPLIEAVLDQRLEVAVAEVSSFQLALSREFSPAVGTWLNVAEDHLDWHRDLEDYVAAKSRIWQAQASSDLAVANAEDDEVLARARGIAASLVTFGAMAGDYHLEGEELVGPNGVLAKLSELPRDLPHDRLNALACFATALGAGASLEGCRGALASAPALEHRVSLVAEIDQVRYFDDSKATTPSAVIAALSSFSHVVLIAGGRNKGLDLSAMRRFVDSAEALSLRAVVAIGEAAPELEAAFSPDYAVVRAASMREAVHAAAGLAKAPDVVLLSPGCASFDWYRSYEERGKDFSCSVLELARR